MPKGNNPIQHEEEISASYQVSPENRRVAFKAMMSYAGPHRKKFVIIFFCTFLAIAADLLQPYLVKIAIDNNLLIGKNDFGMLLIISGVYLALSVIGLTFTYLQNNLLQFTGQSIVGRIRKDLFEHISKLSMSFFDRFQSGSLVTHVSSDTETISQFFTQVFLSLIRDGMTLVFIIILMFHLDPTLAAYSMLLIPIIAAIAIGFRSYIRKTYQLARTQLSRLVAFVAENLAGMNLIQAFHQEREQTNQFTDRNQKYYRANIREVTTNVLFNRSFDLLGNLSVAFLVWIGGMAVFNKSIEFGVLYAFITYIRQFFQPINNITQQWNTLQSTMVSMDRLWRIFSMDPQIKDAEQPKAVNLDTVKGRIDYNHIKFGYSEDAPVIHDLDLHIRPGEMIGIVGTTGAGKSSLMSLLCRFYEVQQGSIQIDGTDIRNIPQHTLHRMIGLVQQEPYLYSGSIVDNVRLFDESISREAVIEACRFVGADALITRLKDGYDTRLSERGSGLSAGERQMISFARIVVFEPKILILDEATANLDSHTEQLVQSALQVVSKGRTTLVIAHRLSTIMQADRIIVMRQGRIVEEGTHAQLLDKAGYYEQLYRHSQGKHALGAS
ncbi:putative multidrug resistance ABC transporter ATP-binding/permease protein YheH [Paenibacillus solanacearum]|uniref:Multidrug resistance ABC transporter ATP-binding/permease protein YheH n=1 Tax=Paenibacillus solanacearum TaxID=2048548 RepID=A0A916K6R6_9BACL|nr:ABC transporter ATP-binding protein [Paenibacillus solanacearum]CAG7649188.1 putative multidrug resistance ABC transporter ATP-binding/permease protein YheH [Paenibacillus solanacearum]